MATMLRDLLGTFFYELERHRFSHAAEVLKVESNYGIIIHYADVVPPLLLFSVCERLYYSMVYLEPIWVQNESLSQMYLQVSTDLRKIIQRFQKLGSVTLNPSPSTPNPPQQGPTSHTSPSKPKSTHSDYSNAQSPILSPDGGGSLHESDKGDHRHPTVLMPRFMEPHQQSESPSLNFHSRYTAIQSARSAISSTSEVDISYFIQLFEQLCDLIRLRRELLSFYCVMANIDSFPYDFKVLAETVTSMKDRYLNSIRHPLLAVFQTHALCEQTVLINLFKTQDALSRFDFMESIYWSFMTKQELIGWKNTIISLASSPSFVTALAALAATNIDKIEEKTLSSNHVVNWLEFFYHALFSKLSLYYYANLKKRNDALSSEHRLIAYKSPLDYYEMVTSFVEKNDVSCICLILKTDGIEYHEEGYKCPDPLEPYEALTGIKSYPVVFQYPQDYSIQKYIPSLISLISESDPIDPGANLNPAPFFDKKLSTTYYLRPVESRLTLVVMASDGKKRNDKPALEFVQHITLLLRNNVTFQMLRPSNMR